MTAPKATTARTFVGQSARVSAIRVAAQALQFIVFSYWTYLNDFGEAGRFSLNLSVTLIITAIGAAGLPTLYGRLAGPRKRDLPFRQCLLVYLLGFSGAIILMLVGLLFSLQAHFSFEVYPYFACLALALAWKELAAEHANMDERFFWAYGAERLVASGVLVTSFLALIAVSRTQFSYPIAFFLANSAGMVFVLYKGIEFKQLKSFRQLSPAVLRVLAASIRDYVQLSLNNLVNTYTFPILLLIGGFFLSADDIGQITLAHMLAAAVLYLQPAFVNRLTPLLYEQIDNRQQRASWRESIDKMILAGFPALLLLILFAAWSITPMNSLHPMTGLLAIAAAFGFGYLSRLVGALNQLWLTHMQRVSTLWQLNFLLLGAGGAALIVGLSSRLGIGYFVLLFALLEWLRAIAFSWWARLAERAT